MTRLPLVLRRVAPRAMGRPPTLMSHLRSLPCFAVLCAVFQEYPHIQEITLLCAVCLWLHRILGSPSYQEITQLCTADMHTSLRLALTYPLLAQYLIHHGTTIATLPLVSTAMFLCMDPMQCLRFDMAVLLLAVTPCLVHLFNHLTIVYLQCLIFDHLHTVLHPVSCLYKTCTQL